MRRWITVLVLLVAGCSPMVSEVEPVVESWRPSEEQLAEVTPMEERKYGAVTIVPSTHSTGSGQAGSESASENEFEVEVVDTPERITTGLSYRDEIGPSTSSGQVQGMLFVLPRRTMPEFWMWGMVMSLDFVWIDCGTVTSNQLTVTSQTDDKFRTCKVVDIDEGVRPPTNPEDLDQPRYQPSGPVTHVLEVVEGWVGENGVEVGNLVKIAG